MNVAMLRQAVEQNGGVRPAARVLGMAESTLRGRLARCEDHQTMPCQRKIRYIRHLVIPDVQSKPGVPNAHLSWIGKYIAAKRPDVIVCIGDFADLPSLSSYDVGRRSFEGRRYKLDLAASHRAMEILCEQFVNITDYKPRMVLTLGNHEHRIERVTEEDPRLYGTIGLEDLGYEAWGWEVIPYLEVINIDGIEYSHYVTSGVMGRPASSAAVALRERQRSVVQGHVQHIDIAIHRKTQAFALFSGTCYLHKEGYLGPQGNSQKPGIWMLNEVRNGTADLMQISLDYLRRKYGHMGS